MMMMILFLLLWNRNKISQYLVTRSFSQLKQSFYLAHNPEAVFVEIIQPKKANMIVGTIYRHPGMPITLFNSDYLKSLLHKITSEKKQILLLGDFNINLLKCDDEPEIASFMDIVGSNLILCQILLPTRVTDLSKTLIDNIFSSLSDS